MKARVRVLAALLALFAFTAAFAEQVWATTCAQTVMAASMAEMGAGAAEHPQAGHDQEMPMPGQGQERHSQLPAGDDCPLRAVAASGCVAFSFPAPDGAVPEFAAAPSGRMVPAAQATPDLLLVFPRFHPPQA
ncbi:MAG: hypothetical protein ACJ8GN_28260 [Longimicrobiaceae bacterium]